MKIPPNIIKWWVFVMEIRCVSCEVKTEYFKYYLDEAQASKSCHYSGR